MRKRKPKKKKKAPEGGSKRVLPTPQDLIRETVEKHGKKLVSDEAKLLEETLTKILVEGMLPMEAMGVDKSMALYMYRYAYEQFNAGNYKEANKIFKLLIFLDPISTKYQHGLGACYHMMKDYEMAITGYFSEAILGPGNPVPFFHIYDCYMNLDIPRAAYANLKAAMTACGNNPKYGELKERCQLLAKGLAKELGIEYKEVAAEEPDVLTKLQEVAKEEQK